MPQSCAKKQAVIGNTSIPLTDSRKDLDKGLFARDLEIVKCITWNVKLIKNNKGILALLEFDSKANLIY